MTLPQGWAETTLGDCQSRTSTVDPRAFPDEVFDLFSVPSYSAYTPETVAGREIGSTKQTVQADDVLLCKIVPHIRRAWVVPRTDGRRQIGSGEWIVFRDHGLEPQFLRRFILSDGFHDQFMQTTAGVGGSLTRARPAEAATIKVPVPPLAEQRRIVAKLDALTDRLTRARADLDRVPVLAEHLRQSAVAHAFDGPLTAAWRSANIGQQALSQADVELAYAAVAGQKRRKSAAEIDWKPDVDVPEGWRWASIDELVAITQYGSSAKTSDDQSGVPVLRMGNIQRGEIDWSSLKYLPANHPEFPELFLEAGDVLFNRTNSFELVGKSAVFRGADRTVSYASYLIRLRCSAILPDLLVRYLNSRYGRGWVEQVASQQVGQANVNGSKLKALGIPLAPPDEQAEMLRLLDAAFARADRLEAEAARARALLDRLESALLAKAFRGELVPQDPNDEPAQTLLDRIRQQRAAAPKAKRGRKAKVAA